MQRTGSFKFRGAYNKLKRLVEQKGARGGVVAFSSGNHAQGVAAAASLLGIKAVIVMPSDAPAIKLANTRGYGAEVVLYDRAGRIARRSPTSSPRIAVPPSCGPLTIPTSSPARAR